MRPGISIRHNLADVIRDLDDLGRKQLPFAVATALTWTAQEVRDDARARLGDHFTVRSTWVEKSMQIDKAEKKDPDPTARVGSLYDPMALHGEGGTKRSKSGAVGVPVGARPSEADITGPDVFPSKLASKPNFFVAPFSRDPFRVGEGPETGVFERLAQHGDALGPVPMRSRKKNSKAEQSRRHLKLWWTLEDEVKIKQDWPFFADGVRVVDSAIFDNFFAAMEQARATARRRP